MKRRTVYVALVLLVVAGIVGFNYMYKDHRDIQSEEPVFIGGAQALNQVYLDAQEGALLNKTVIITGTVTSVEEGGTTIDEAVFVSYALGTELPAVAQKVTLKGRCIGYDELFELVTIDQATLTD